jgi:hypothetical protein
VLLTPYRVKNAARHHQGVYAEMGKVSHRSNFSRLFLGVFISASFR